MFISHRYQFSGLTKKVRLGPEPSIQYFSRIFDKKDVVLGGLFHSSYQENESH